jgi:hypothetical protein
VKDSRPSGQKGVEMAIAIYVLYRVKEGQAEYLDFYGTPQLAHEMGNKVYQGDFKVWPISVPDNAGWNDVIKKAKKEVSKLKD